MPATIIDALVVTLGLDGGPYKRAVRDAEREQAKLRNSAKKSGDEVSSTLAEVGRQAALLFLGFEGIKGAINFFSDLNAATANLGRFSKNLGESAHEVSTWDSAVELAGGSAKDAQSDLLGLSNSITALKATGDVSPLLLLFQRMGVAIYDAQGRTRKLTDLYKDLGDKLKQYNRADAFNLARQAGLTESTFNLIRAEGAERERLLQLAEQNNSVTDEATQKAAELQQEWRGIGQTVKGVSLTILGDITPTVQSLFGWVQKLFSGVKNTGFLQGVFSALSGAAKVLVDVVRVAWSGISQLFGLFADSRVGKWLGALLTKFGHFAKDFGGEFVDQADRMADQYAPKEKDVKPKTTADYRTKIAQTEKELGIPTGVLDKLARTESNYDPNARNKRTGATGIVQLLPKYFPNAGKDANADIDTGGKYLLQLYRQFGSWELAAAAYNTGPGNLKKVLAGAKSLPTETKNYVGSIFGANDNALAAARFASNQAAPGQSVGSAGNTSTTKIDIDQINVHAPNAKDADGIAAELPGALRRKGIVAQADSGMS